MKVDLELIRQSVHPGLRRRRPQKRESERCRQSKAGEQANGHEVLIIGDAAQIMRQEGQWSALVDSYGPQHALTPNRTAANLLSRRRKIASVA